MLSFEKKNGTFQHKNGVEIPRLFVNEWYFHKTENKKKQCTVSSALTNSILCCNRKLLGRDRNKYANNINKVFC